MSNQAQAADILAQASTRELQQIYRALVTLGDAVSPEVAAGREQVGVELDRRREMG